jgi:hypothetical protein
MPLDEVIEVMTGQGFRDEALSRIGDVGISFQQGNFLAVCETSRRTKKPILLLSITENSEANFELLGTAFQSSGVRNFTE